MRPRLACLISGRGSNMRALHAACVRGAIAADLRLVLSNRADAGGLAYAREAGIEHAVVDHTAFATREDFDRAVLAELRAARIDYVLLAGFMRILSPVLVSAYEGRMLNIHPSLLPKYPGLHTHRRAIEAGDSEAGATVHFVIEALDAGAAIGQVRVPILPTDTESLLSERVLAQEHGLYVACVQQVVSGAVVWSAGRALHHGAPLVAPLTFDHLNP
jgi:phosphoribosylglycinamide formyltransferase 1